MTDVTIGTLENSAWRAYREVRLRALQSDPSAFLSSFAREAAFPDEKWQERLAAANEGKRSWMLFAKQGEALVGMIGGYQNDEDLANGLVEIWGVWVAPEARGRGIAKRLMTAILEKLNSIPDIESIKLEVNTDQEAAKKLYEGFGFRVVKTDEEILGDGKHHQITKMKRKSMLL